MSACARSSRRWCAWWGKRRAGAPHESLLVLDATIGPERRRQAEALRGGAPHGTRDQEAGWHSEGGSVVALRRAVPCRSRFLGTGETLEDLELFDPMRFAHRRGERVKLASSTPGQVPQGRWPQTRRGAAAPRHPHRRGSPYHVPHRYLDARRSRRWRVAIGQDVTLCRPRCQHGGGCPPGGELRVFRAY